VSDYGFWPRLGFYVCAVVGGAVIGALLLCGVATLDLLRGLVIPWSDVVAKGASIGGLGASVGALWVFVP
jgi:hypothetical protein